MTAPKKPTPIGDGSELKKYITEQLGWTNDKTGASKETFVKCLEQLIILDHDDDRKLEEILTIIKSYYKSKETNIHFANESINDTNGQIFFINPETKIYDSLIITNSRTTLLITINTNLYQYIGPSKALQNQC